MKHSDLVLSAELRGHKADVRALTLHAGHLVSTGYDGLVHVWDVSKPDAPLNTLGDASNGRLLALCDVPNQRLLACAGVDGVIRLWDARTGKLTGKLDGHVSSVCALLARAQYAELFSGGSDEHVLIWDLRVNQGMSSLRGHATSTRCLAFGPNDEGDGGPSQLFTGGGDAQVRSWNVRRDSRASVQSYNAAEVLQGPLFSISALSYDSSLSLLSAAGMDNAIYCWDLRAASQFTPEGRIRTACKALRGHTSVVNALVSWGDRGLISASADGTLRIWDTSMGDKELASWRTFQVSEGVLVSSVRALHALDPQRLCTGSSDGCIKVWQAVDEL